MTHFFEKQIAAFSSHKLPRLPSGDDLVYPDFGGRSLSNLPAAICTWLSVPPLGSSGLRDEYRSRFPGGYKKVVLFLIDGMGLRFLERCLNDGDLSKQAPIWNRLAVAGDVYALTSTCPSTTSSALTSLWTGLTPAEHGVIGYEMWLKEFGVVVNMVNHSPSAFPGDPGSLRRAGFRPESFLPAPTLGSHLALHGVSTRVFQHHTLSHSGLSTMLMDGVEIYPYLTQADLWVSLGDLLEHWNQGPLYSYVYWSDFDLLQHRFSSTNPRTENEFIQFSRQLHDFIEGLSPGSRRDALFVFAADHGQIPTPQAANRELARHPDLRSCLAMQPTCENRLAFLYLRPGMEQALRDYVRSTWGEDYLLISSVEAIQSGLFGSGSQHPALAERVGDLVSIARDGAYWWWNNRENRQVSRHGGLSPEEMLVPLLLCTLE
jgi:predicted AlkP superfamily pyrophosphatase or phosphodiesterase